MKGGPLSQALEEIKRSGNQDADLERIARRHGVDARRLRQRLSRSATFVRSIEMNRTSPSPSPTTSSMPPRRGSGEKRRTQLRFVVNGLVLKLYRQEFYRGELRVHTRRGCEQCSCGRDLISHAVPVVSEARRPSLLCECGAAYEAEASP